METKKNACCSVVLFLLLSQHSAHAFFFPQFIRRQIFSGGESQPAARGQVGGVEDQSNFRIINRPRLINGLGQIPLGSDQSFQVSQALCLACGNFPWTPVAGKESVISQPSTGGATPSQPITDNTQTNSNKKPQQSPGFVNPDDYPIHQHLQVTKEPGNTVVINALGPDGADGNRKPYAFSFGAQQNTVNPAKNQQQLGRPIVIPYEQPKTQPPMQQRPLDVPRQPSASSIASGYAQPPLQYKPQQQESTNQQQVGANGKQTQVLAFNPPSTNLPPRQQQPSPIPTGSHPQNIPPITVGTILAAQQHFQIHPAKLVYQEHTHSQSHSPTIYAPLPLRPQYAPPQLEYAPQFAPPQLEYAPQFPPQQFEYAPQFAPQPIPQSQPPLQQQPPQSSPQSFKLPILSGAPRPSGTVTLNQIPIHAVPNYNPLPLPHPRPHFLLPSNLNYPTPAQPPQMPPQYFHPEQQVYFPLPRQPKPGYAPLQTYEPSENNKYRVPQQQRLPNTLSGKENASPGKGEFSGGDRPYAQLPQKPQPPTRPYVPPQPSPTSRPIIFLEKNTQPPPPGPTYIPPRVSGQLFTSYAEDTKAEEQEILSFNHIRQETRANEEKVVFPPPKATLELGPPKHVEENPPAFRFPTPTEQKQKQKAPRFEESDPPFHQPITIPNLLHIQQGYRFIDQSANGSPGRVYGQQFLIPVTPKSVPLEHVIKPTAQTHTRQQPIREQERPTPTTPFPTTLEPIRGELQTNDYVLKSAERDEGREEKTTGERFGAYEIVPAAQYDITHLFAQKGKAVTSGGEASQETRQKPHSFPVPISEADAAHSKSPLFVVTPPVAAEENFYHPFGTSSRVEEGNEESLAHFQPTSQYDPLPPSIVSALHHAQRTSFLTHQHLLPATNAKENTFYVNSVSVAEANTQKTTSFPDTPRILRPIAFDLNSGKEIQIQSNRNAEIQSLQTVLEEDAERRKTIPVYTLQQESAIRPIFSTNQNTGSSDQSVANCQNNQQWLSPPTRNNVENAEDGNQLPTYDAQPTFYPQQYKEQREEVGIEGKNQFVVYYPSPLPSSLPSSMYWTRPTPSPPAPKQYMYGERITGGGDVVVNDNEEEYRPTERSKTYLAKPVPRWSKVIESKVKPFYPTPTLPPLTNQNEEEESTTTHAAANVFGKDHVTLVEQNMDERLEAESKESLSSGRPKAVDDTYPIVLERGGAETEIVGPTTVADCITEATTEGIASTEEPTTQTTPKPTFSPRLLPKPQDERLKSRGGGSRFPTGRPTISTFRASTEDSASGVSASVLVPVYRPSQNLPSILQNVLRVTANAPTPVEQIYRTQEVESLGTEEEPPSTTTPTTPTSTLPEELSTNEDDEADDLRSSNQIGEVPTARKVPATATTNLGMPEIVTAKSITTPTTTSKILFSSQILPTTPSTASGPTSTKIVKTVRVRQRMRPAHVPGFTTTSGQLRSRVSGASSRVRIMTRTSAAEYAKTHSESATPETEALGEEEQKEVKDALFESRKL